MVSTAIAPSRHSLVTAGLLAINIFAWGSNYALVKLALRDISPFTFNAARFAGAAVIVAALIGAGRHQLLPFPGERTRLAAVGIFQVTMMLGFTALGLLYIEASRAVLLAYTMPLWALLLGRFALGERITRQKMLGGAIGFLGLGLLFNPFSLEWADRGVLIGSGIAILGSIGWAAGSTIYRTCVWRSSFWSQVFWQVFIGSLPLFALAVVFEWGDPIRPTGTLLALIGYNWLIPAALAYWSWSRVLTRLPVASAGQILMLAPVWGVALSMIIFREPFRPLMLASGVLVLVGAWLTLQAGGSRPGRA